METLRRTTKNQINPIRSSMKCLTRGGIKVLGSIRRKEKSAPCVHFTKPSEEYSKPSLTEFPKESEQPEPLSSSFNSSISVATSTDQKHYTCLSPVEFSKILSKPDYSKSKLEDIAQLKTQSLTSYNCKTGGEPEKNGLLAKPEEHCLKYEERRIFCGSQLREENIPHYCDEGNKFCETLNCIPGFKFKEEGTTPINQLTPDNIHDLEKKRPNFGFLSSREKLIKQKFIVNLFESRAGKRNSTTKLRVENTGKIELKNQDREQYLSKTVGSKNAVFFKGGAPKNSSFSCEPANNTNFTSSIRSKVSTSDLLRNKHDEMFAESHNQKIYSLRKRRNQECAKIGEVSDALSVLRIDKKTPLDALLQAEKALLLSTERVRLYTKIMVFKEITETPKTAATVTISKITIPLKAEFGKMYCNAYFICLLRTDDRILTTKYVQLQSKEGGQYIEFDDELEFQKLSENFKISVKVYSLRTDFPKAKRSGIGKLFPRKAVAYPIKTYLYEDLLTNSIQQRVFLQPILKQNAQFIISEANFSRSEACNYCMNSIFHQYASFSKSLSTFAN